MNLSFLASILNVNLKFFFKLTWQKDVCDGQVSCVPVAGFQQEIIFGFWVGFGFGFGAVWMPLKKLIL